ncbi:methyltransferase domain-containing protein [Nocardiopsis sp. CT-R113]|uniref:Methyltransferase domain-containing protein n=1 Tax=Nocardiopsis codii TaxID=3065942 RepID=A0ABU7K5G3_9ACTN|nr:methyltransferase domain-containing protein [Nocardiopsis sp. CT-R113]
MPQVSAAGTGIDAGAAPWLCDPYSQALSSGRGPLFLRRSDGWMLPLEVERWCGGTDAADESVLERSEGDTLDVGCGPGRMVATLTARGRRALGVDTNPVAVSRAVEGGARAVCSSVFDPLPGEGGWCTALLLDGNIGIGGAPGDLLARVREIVLPGGLLIVEAAAQDVHERVTVQVTDGCGDPGAPFPWARVGLPALRRCAGSSGWTWTEAWHVHGRRFAALRAPR